MPETCRVCGTVLTPRNRYPIDIKGKRRLCKACRWQETRAWRKANVDRYRKHEREYRKIWRIKNIDKERAYQKANAKRLRLEVLAHYSPKMVCQCNVEGCWHNGKCVVTDLRTLSIDHVFGRGNAHRRDVLHGRLAGGKWFNQWLKRNGYPNGFQVLCMNCQFVKGARQRSLP